MCLSEGTSIGIVPGAIGTYGVEGLSGDTGDAFYLGPLSTIGCGDLRS